jgi:hypothetical protein
MTTGNSLSQIIRPVTEHANPAIGYQALIVIDARSGQSVSKPTMFDSLMGDFRYFLVSNNRDPKSVISGIKQVRYKEGPGEIVFSITYQGGCPPGKEWWLAQCFFKSPRSEDGIRDCLAKWFIEFFASTGRTIDDFYAYEMKACTDLVAKAGQEFGLELRISLAVEGLGALQTIDLGPNLISSRLKDLDEEKSITFKVELGVDPLRKLRALLHQKTSLTEVVNKGVRYYLANSVTLDTFCDDLNSAQVKRELQAHLESLLQPFGRRAEFLSLKPEAGASPQAFKGETEIEFIHHEYPDPIRIKVSALMSPVNRAVYFSNGAPDLNDWLNRNLRSAIDEVLFGVSYVDLLLTFPELKKRIDVAVSLRAKKIGYEVKQLMTVLFLEPFKWLKRIDIEIKDSSQTNGQSSEAMFETSLSGFYVGLEIFVTARVKDLRGIERYLITKQDVPGQMKEEIIRLVQRTMHGTDPERFYRYSYVDNEHTNQRTFEQEIREKITSLLETEFNAEVNHLVLKPAETVLTRKFDAIAKASHQFAAPAEIGQAPGAAMIVVRGRFMVKGVSADDDGWKTFKDREINADIIKQRIEDSIQASLKRESDDSLLADLNNLDLMVSRALVLADAVVEEEFGITIKLSTVYWEWDESLKRIGQAQSQKEIAAVHERLSRLREQLLSYIEVDAGSDMIQDVQDRISRLEATLPPALASGAGIRRLGNVPAPPSLPGNPQLLEGVVTTGNGRPEAGQTRADSLGGHERQEFGESEPN